MSLLLLALSAHAVQVPGYYADLQSAILAGETLIELDGAQLLAGEDVVIDTGGAGVVTIIGLNQPVLGSLVINNMTVELSGVDVYPPSSLTYAYLGEHRGIYVTDSDLTLTNVYVSGGDADYGGGLKAHGSSVVSCHACDFWANKAGSSGGNVLLADATTMYAEGSTFRDGTAVVAGGGVYVDVGASLTLVGGDVSFNQADLGGGVYVAGALDASEDTSFETNTAYSYGGGLYVDASATADLTDAAFVWNGAATGAGGFVLGDLALTRAQLSGNIASIRGGGLYVSSAGEATLVFADLTDNTADLGGGAAVDGVLTATDSSFTAHEAWSDGGALQGGYSSSLTVTHCAFSDNHAWNNGGAIAPNGRLVATASTFDYNAADQVGGAISGGGGGEIFANRFCANDASQGGAQYLSELVTYHHNVYSGNTAQDGAALYISNFGASAFDTFVDNGASTTIELANFASFDLDYSILAYNRMGPVASFVAGFTYTGLLFWGNSDDLGLGGIRADPYLTWSDDGDCTNDAFTLDPSSSPAIDISPYDFDADGTPADLGAYSGEVVPGDGRPLDDDSDGDGVLAQYDCNPGRGDVYPGAPEACDAVDNDCDGQIDEGVAGPLYFDGDGDGYGDQPVGEGCPSESFSALPGDCDDLRVDVSPDGQEVCDGLDNDCANGPDDGIIVPTWYADGDHDGVGAGAAIHACEQPLFSSPLSDDCDDGDDANFPGNPEVCDDADNDCDGLPDDGVPTTTWYMDRDGDTYGDASVAALVDCAQPDYTSAVAGDCDDGEGAIHPGAVDVPGNLLDEDCVDGPAELPTGTTETTDTTGTTGPTGPTGPTGTDTGADEDTASPASATSWLGGGGCDQTSGAVPAAPWLALLIFARRRARVG